VFVGFVELIAFIEFIKLSAFEGRMQIFYEVG
jgi:hypothetical protein